MSSILYPSHLTVYMSFMFKFNLYLNSNDYEIPPIRFP